MLKEEEKGGAWDSANAQLGRFITDREKKLSLKKGGGNKSSVGREGCSGGRISYASSTVRFLERAPGIQH